MMSTAILIGALIIGDSVRHSLQQIVFDRLGRTEFALTGGDRLLRIRTADKLSEILKTPVAPILLTRGIAIAEGGQRRINNTQVIGVDARFGIIGHVKNIFENIAPDEAVINSHLSSRIGLKEGDEFLLRIEKLDFMPKDAPLALDTESIVARRFKIRKIVTDSEFGRFHLKANQVAPYTVFVSLSSLNRIMELDKRANIVLISERSDAPLNPKLIDSAFKDVWTLADAGFELVKLVDRQLIEFRSKRIFLDPSVADQAIQIDENVRFIFTYFVNEIHRGDRSTPYSFVSAPGKGFIPSDMQDDEIIINDWLARDLNANTGDQIELVYYVLGPMHNFEEVRSNFRVKGIVPLKGLYADKDLLPDFPGLSGEVNCRDWEPGIPIDLDKIRQKDEDYWKNYRGTPKAFVTLHAAQTMWQNRFGKLTAIRFTGMEREKIENHLRRGLDPASLGFTVNSVRKEGQEASTKSVSFSQLFLGLSFFIIIAALLLTGLLFVFNIEERSEETGLLLALGFPKQQLKRCILFETAVLLFIGGALGIILGLLYNQIILVALRTIWYDVVGTTALQIHLKFSTVLMGVLIGIVLTLFTIWFIIRKQFKQTISGLQKGVTRLERIPKGKPRISMGIGLSGVIAVVIILILTNPESGGESFGAYFTAGTLLLMSGVAFANAFLYVKGVRSNAIKLNLFNIGILHNTRRRFRSITLIGLLASGLFIVFTVGANQKSALKDTEKRTSGTGGFALFGESTIPILYDLNREKGRQFYSLDPVNADAIEFVQFRVKEGDDASCLNLNRVSKPQLIGVDPGKLAERAAFTFVKRTEEVPQESPWSVLRKNLSDDVIPGIADQTVIVWGLGKTIGDTLIYMDEKGEIFKVKLVGGLANSIFQGNVIISEEAFTQRYPSVSGYRLFLIDAPSKDINEISRELSWAMQDQGFDLMPASTRLAEFNKVQNTYLSIFLILGSFGLILGSIGIGIVVWRNVNEQRGELALLRAIGFNRKSIQTIIFSEHIVLLIGGLFYGIVASFLATLPSILTPGSEFPFFTFIFLMVVVLMNGCVWTTLATTMTTRGDLLPALRNE